MNLLPVLRRTTAVVEAAPSVQPPVVQRRGFIPGIPDGGATANNPANGPTGASLTRSQYMTALLRMYVACIWVSDAVDSIAAVVTAGGVEIVPEVEPTSDIHPPKPTPDVVAAQELFAWCNPEEDIVQLSNRIVVDLEVFGDAFIEVSWVMDRPVALWSLDVPTMNILADEHGIVTGYMQQLDTKRVATFEPREVIHFKLDSPGGGMYGLGPTQKAEIAVTEWLYYSALVKEIGKQGDPPRVHIDWPLVMQEPDIERFSAKFRTRNRGSSNIANPIETKGGGKVTELQKNRIIDYLATLDQKRDEIISKFHTPPAVLGIIESGNLGGGTSSGQFKTFKVIACQKPAAQVSEKLTSRILKEGFGIKGWKVVFGEYDWRDDLIVEQIRDMRLRNGSWTLNRYRSDIGEPAVDGGDDPVLVDRQNFVLWRDMDAMSKATVASKAVIPGAVVPKDGPTDDDEPPKAQPPKEWEPPREATDPSWMRRYRVRQLALAREAEERLPERVPELVES